MQYHVIMRMSAPLIQGLLAAACVGVSVEKLSLRFQGSHKRHAPGGHARLPSRDRAGVRRARRRAALAGGARAAARAPLGCM